MKRDEHTFLTAVAIQILNRWLPLGPVPTDQEFKHWMNQEFNRELPGQNELDDPPWFEITPPLLEITYWQRLLESYDQSHPTAFYQWFPWLLNPKIKSKLTFNLWAKAAATHLYHTHYHGARVILAHHNLFPPLLRPQERGPLFLTVWGNTDLLKSPLVSIVGSRKASPEALRESYRAGHRLAENGITVVSGGAFGCDIACHQGVLASKKNPAPGIVIFANGLGNLYPRSNLPVFRELFKMGGLLVSERLWESKPFPSDFATRNRIIAGMSGLTLLMQAGLKSGAMITARLALEQGSDLAVMTHPTYDVRAEGSHRLIEEGAFSFESIEEVLTVLSGSSSIQSQK